MDWKEALLAQSRAMGIDPSDAPADTEQKPEAVPDSSTDDTLHIVMERKGRGGKTATIIEGFTCSPEKLKETAAILKQRLGTGGSARGGEILIQGDRREDVRKVLINLGYKHVK